jgi:hypothetical protein
MPLAAGSPASFGVPAPMSAPTGPAPGSGPPAAQRGDEPGSRSQGAQPYPPDPFLDRLPAPAADAAPGQQAAQPGGSQRHGIGGGRSYPPPDPYPPGDLYPAAGQYPAGQYPPGQYPAAGGGQHGGAGGQLPPGPFSGPQHGQHGGALSPPFAGPQDGPYSGPQAAAAQPPVAISLADAVQAAHAEGVGFGEAVARDAPALWLEAVLARKPRMPSDLEARLLQGSALPIDSLLHDEVRHALRRGFWDALERSRR